MTKIPEEDCYDEKMTLSLAKMADAGVRNAARGISSMIGEEISVGCPKISMVPIARITDLLGGPENEAVGIYLRTDRKLSGQMMMVIPFNLAIELVDMMLGQPIGTTQTLGAMERSALAELGNMTGSYFLNAVADLTGLDGRPSPPAVMVDMIGAILNILLATWDGVSENVLMIQATFMRGERQAEASFWVIPDHSTLEFVNRRENAGNGE